MSARQQGSLVVDDVHITLGGVEVVRGVSARIAPGELVTVIGANGAGKSTLLRALAGLAIPSGGRVLLDGARLQSFDARAIARRIAYLPQDRIVHWPLDAAAVVALGRLPHRSFAAAESDEDREAVRLAMQRMDVAQFSQRPIATLSGGERARVLVARALAQGAQYLIADEPTAGLDPAHALIMFEEFRRLCGDGHAVIVALHDLSLAARYASSVVIMRRGVCIGIGPPAQELSNAALGAAFGVNAAITNVDGIPVIVPRTPLT